MLLIQSPATFVAFLVNLLGFFPLVLGWLAHPCVKSSVQTCIVLMLLHVGSRHSLGESTVRIYEQYPFQS